MKETMEGKCKYCGQVIWVEAENEEDADLQARKKCDCGGYEKEKRLEEAKAAIHDLCVVSAEKDGKEIMPQNVGELLYQCAEQINEEQIDKVAIDAWKIKITMQMTSKGKIKVTRTDKETSTREV